MNRGIDQDTPGLSDRGTYEPGLLVQKVLNLYQSVTVLGERKQMLRIVALMCSKFQSLGSVPWMPVVKMVNGSKVAGFVLLDIRSEGCLSVDCALLGSVLCPVGRRKVVCRLVNSVALLGLPNLVKILPYAIRRPHNLATSVLAVHSTSILPGPQPRSPD